VDLVSRMGGRIGCRAKADEGQGSAARIWRTQLFSLSCSLAHVWSAVTKLAIARSPHSPWKVPDHHVHDPVITIQIPLSSLQQPPNSTKSSEPCPHSLIPIYAKNVQGGPHCCLKSVSNDLQTTCSPRTACRIRIFGLRLISSEGV
jgi:hypothetical protein